MIKILYTLLVWNKTHYWIKLNFLDFVINRENEIGVRQLSLTGGQRVIRFDYLKKCTTNQYKCGPENVLCNEMSGNQVYRLIIYKYI